MRQNSNAAWVRELTTYLQQATENSVLRSQCLLNRMHAYYELGMYRKSLKDADEIVTTNEAKDHNLIYFRQHAILIKAKIEIVLHRLEHAKELLQRILDNDDPKSMEFKVFVEARDLLRGLESGWIRGGTRVELVGALCRTSGDEFAPNASVVNEQVENDKDDTGIRIENQGAPDVQRAIELVNKGMYTEAVAILNDILDTDDKNVAAFATRGTARAFLGQFEGAVTDFNEAIHLHPNLSDFYARRSQALAALGRIGEALKDLEKSRECVKGSGREKGRLWLDSAKLHQKLQQPQTAKMAIMEAVACHPALETLQETKEILALSEISCGNLDRGIEILKGLIDLDPSNKIATLNLAMCFKEKGEIGPAMHYLKKSMSLFSISSTGMIAARRLAVHLYRSIGKYSRALLHINAVLNCSPDLGVTEKAEFLFMKGSCHHAIGEFKQATEAYRKAVTLDITDLAAAEFVCAAFYQKEMALWLCNNLGQPQDSSCLDLEFSPAFKELWCKRATPPETFVQEYAAYLQQDRSIDIKFNFQMFSSITDVLQTADALGSLVSYRHPGFVENNRHIRAAGLAAIELAQFLRNMAASHNSVYVNNKGSSVYGRGPDRSLQYNPSKQTQGMHKVCWRDAMDILVKWRQLAEPSDSVIWVDLLSEEEFKSGFGSHTPMYSGHAKCVRYYSNFSRACKLLYRLLTEERAQMRDKENHIIRESYISPEKILTAVVAQDVWEAVGGQCAWVSIPIRSTRHHSKEEESVLEGARLTVVDVPLNGVGSHNDFLRELRMVGKDAIGAPSTEQSPSQFGHEFSIRTPVTMDRWSQYDKELQFWFEQFISELSCAQPDKNTLLDHALTLAFYWYNFMPLARGSAFCGYTMLLGCQLAAGILRPIPIPINMQVDWEALLEPEVGAFIKVMRSWLLAPQDKANNTKADSIPVSVDSLPLIANILPTIRERIGVLAITDDIIDA